jgi:hypothetical protein
MSLIPPDKTPLEKEREALVDDLNKLPGQIADLVKNLIRRVLNNPRYTAQEIVNGWPQAIVFVRAFEAMRTFFAGIGLDPDALLPRDGRVRVVDGVVTIVDPPVDDQTVKPSPNEPEAE